MTSPRSHSRTGVHAALDWLNFFLADVRGTLGPYLGIYLLTVQQWNQGAIGLLMTATELAGLVAQLLTGALVDVTHRKRSVLVAGVVGLAMSACIVPHVANFWAVLSLKLFMNAAGAILGPAVAAITLGVVGYRALAGRMGRNAAFDHAGNVFIALAAAVVGTWFSQQAIFYLAPAFAFGCVFAVSRIPVAAIDHDLARGLDKSEGAHAAPISYGALLSHRPLLVLAVCAALFHFANAPMLQLVGQRLALAHPGQEALMMSACVIGAQAVMLPVALWAGKRADAWGRKTVFLIAFVMLPVRGFLYTLSDDRFWLLGVQLLDGVGAGVFGVVTPLIIADLMRGTGRFNTSMGLVATIQGIGAALSNVVAGAIVVKFGYDAAFLCLASVAIAALVIFSLAMPETRSRADAGMLA